MRQILTLLILTLSLFAPRMTRADHVRITPVPVIRNHGHISIYKARELVQLLYQAALFRDAEPAGLDHWSRMIVSQGMTGLKAVARGIGGSVEFQQNIQGYYTSDEILSNIYFVIFDREVDPTGYAGWIPLLDRRQGTRVLEGIVGSQEFFERHLYR